MDAIGLRTERERLGSLAESLRTAFSDIVEAAADVATDDEHDPEGHTIAFERQQQAAILRSTEQQLRELDRAIEKTASGSYGSCEQCAEAIPPARLEAVPATRWCVRCVSIPS